MFSPSSSVFGHYLLSLTDLLPLGSVLAAAFFALIFSFKLLIFC